MLPSTNTESTSVANYTLVSNHIENQVSGGFDSNSSDGFNSAGVSEISDYTSAYCNDLTAINAFIDSLKSDYLLGRG